MTLRRLIARLLAISVIAGLVLAPLSPHAMAGTPTAGSISAMADDMSMSATADSMATAADDMPMSAMSGETTRDMPCCPAKALAPIGCDKCVLMAACMSQCLAGVSTALFRPPFAASGKLVLGILPRATFAGTPDSGARLPQVGNFGLPDCGAIGSPKGRSPPTD